MKFQDSYYHPVEKQLSQLFYEIYFKPIFDLIQESKEYSNSIDVVINAIRKGQIILKGKEITGKFTLAISKELNKFAKFDGRSKKWIIYNASLVPSHITSTALIANDKSKKLHEEIARRLQGMDKEARKKFKNLKYDINQSADQIEAALRQDFKKYGIVKEIPPQIKKQLVKQYNQNMSLSIVNEQNPAESWNNEQVERLRSMIEKSAMQGYNKNNLIESIKSEFDISMAKSKFLSRQETSIFLSDLTADGYMDAGVDLYRWSNSHDNRTVGNPSGKYPIKPSDYSKASQSGHGNHWILGGKICKFSDSTVYADSIEDAKKNKWKPRSLIGADSNRPGIGWLCRCVPIPVVIY